MSRELKPKGNNVRECPLELFCAGEAMSYNLSQDVFLYYQFGLCQIFWSKFSTAHKWQFDLFELVGWKTFNYFVVRQFWNFQQAVHCGNIFVALFMRPFYLFYLFIRPGSTRPSSAGPSRWLCPSRHLEFDGIRPFLYIFIYDMVSV